MALDSLRSALRHPSDAPLGYARRQLLWWRNRCVRAQLYSGRCDRRFRPGLAPAGGDMVYDVDNLPTNHRTVKKAGAHPSVYPRVVLLPFCTIITFGYFKYLLHFDVSG